MKNCAHGSRLEKPNLYDKCIGPLSVPCYLNVQTLLYSVQPPMVQLNFFLHFLALDLLK